MPILLALPSRPSAIIVTVVVQDDAVGWRGDVRILGLIDKVGAKAEVWGFLRGRNQLDCSRSSDSFDTATSVTTHAQRLTNDTRE